MGQTTVNQAITNVIRVLVVLGVLSALHYRHNYDEYIQEFWDWARKQWWMKHDSFEPVVATLGFACPMLMWWGIDIGVDEGWLPHMNQFQIIQIGRTNIGLTMGNCELNALLSGLAYLLPLLTFDYLVPRRRLPITSPGFWEMVIGVIAAIWLYDLLFYPIHVSMHKVRSLRRFHQRHHPSRPLTSAETLRHGLLDGTLQVACSILSVNILQLHPLTRAVYNVVVTYLLTELHCGYDAPWMLHRVVPHGLLGGPKRHEIHHATGCHNFHQFFTYLDTCFGYVKDELPNSSTKQQVSHKQVDKVHEE